MKVSSVLLIIIFFIFNNSSAEAGIRAWLDMLARGGSEQDAWDAGCDAAGLERGC